MPGAHEPTCRCEECTQSLGDEDAEDVLLFDGSCAMCSGSVRFLNRRLHRGRGLRFVGQETSEGAEILATMDEDVKSVDSVFLIRKGRTHIRSAAMIRCLLYLRPPWLWFFPLLWLIPKPIRDLGYWCIARSRHHWNIRKMNRS